MNRSTYTYVYTDTHSFIATHMQSQHREPRTSLCKRSSSRPVEITRLEGAKSAGSSSQSAANGSGAASGGQGSLLSCCAALACSHTCTCMHISYMMYSCTQVHEEEKPKEKNTCQEIEQDTQKPKEKDPRKEIEQDTQKPKEKDPRREIGQDTQKPKEKDPREEIRQDTQKPKEKDPQEIEQEGAKPKEKDPRQEIEQDTGKKPKQAYKYPLEAPPTEVIDKVHGLVSTAVPPRYEEQLGSKKRQAPAKKKADAAEQDEDDAEEPVDPEEVIQSMEAMCLEEARKEAQAGRFAARGMIECA